jgi:hypothetical protein
MTLRLYVVQRQKELVGIPYFICSASSILYYPSYLYLILLLASLSLSHTIFQLFKIREYFQFQIWQTPHQISAVGTEPRGFCVTCILENPTRYGMHTKRIK